jgi:lysophospholipase II
MDVMSEDPLPNIEGLIWSTVEPTVVEPTSKHRFTIVLCHGRGSTGRYFKDELFESVGSSGLTLREHFPSVKWVFPSAGLPIDPREYVQDEAQWFAISSLLDPDKEQLRQKYGVSQSIKYLHRIIGQETQKLNGKSSRIILGGISQGAAVAVHALLSGPNRLNSFIGFCSWLPFREVLDEFLFDSGLPVPFELRLRALYQWSLGIESTLFSSTRTGDVALAEADVLPMATPCFLSHNADDDVIDVKLGRAMRDSLRSLGMKVKWDEHENGDAVLKHWIKEPEGIDHLFAFLESRMGSPKDAVTAGDSSASS